jgi:hypothetical protein
MLIRLVALLPQTTDKGSSLPLGGVRWTTRYCSICACSKSGGEHGAVQVECYNVWDVHSVASQESLRRPELPTQIALATKVICTVRSCDQMRNKCKDACIQQMNTGLSYTCTRASRHSCVICRCSSMTLLHLHVSHAMSRGASANPS